MNGGGDQDVQDNGEFRSPSGKRRKRQRSRAGQRASRPAGIEYGAVEAETPGIPAEHAGGAELGRELQPSPRAGGLGVKPDKFPLNLSTGPSYEIDGTVLKVTP